jgi:beta-lactam-binding protein with PASTA domain
MRLLRIFAKLLVLIIVALASTLVSMRFAIHGREVNVPDLRGLTPAQAENAAYDRGLELVWSERFYSATVPAGHIVSQQPDPGTPVRRGWQVQASRSLGPQLIDVPSLVGKSPRAAEIDIRRRGLEVGSSAQLPMLPSSSSPDDPTVLAQCPDAGAQGIASPRIGLLYSAPAPEAAYAMPDLRGMPLAEAAKLITASGLKITSITSSRHHGNPDAASGKDGAPAPASQAVNVAAVLANHDAGQSTIVAQSPPAGSRVTASDALSLEVAHSL